MTDDTNSAPQGVFQARLPLVLASASPRRSDLLASAGLEFEILPAGAEPDPDEDEAPEAYALRAARAKAVEVASLRPEAVVLAADTIVVLDEEILGKPEDDTQAMIMLSRLAGRAHRVVTGCCLIRPGAEPEEFAASTDVVMGSQPLDALMAYVATGEPRDKAGAYAIQGRGAFLVREVSGSYTNVVGLPLARVLEVLAEWGVIVPRQG